METRIVSKALTAEVFRQLAGALEPDQVVAQYGYLAKKPAVVLMTSNFSEASRMSRENELVAYEQFVKQLKLAPESTLVIKPHPRDREDKIRELTSRFESMFANVVLLDDPNLIYTPFEVFLMQTFESENGTTPRDLKIITFSTACLSLPILFNLRPIIGFGTEIVKALFFEIHISGRINHERDLQAAVDSLIADGSDLSTQSLGLYDNRVSRS
jgi:hypothetical protein